MPSFSQRFAEKRARLFTIALILKQLERPIRAVLWYKKAYGAESKALIFIEKICSL
jgi:hypothetical protein